MRLAALLLLLIVGTHYAYPLVSQLYPDPDRAARAIFYVARGIEGAVLFFLLGLLARQPMVWAVCMWGVWEEGITAACRLAHGIMNDITPSAWTGLCGVGWYGIFIAFGLGIYLQDHIRDGK